MAPCAGRAWFVRRAGSQKYRFIGMVRVKDNTYPVFLPPILAACSGGMYCCSKLCVQKAAVCTTGVWRICSQLQRALSQRTMSLEEVHHNDYFVAFSIPLKMDIWPGRLRGVGTKLPLGPPFHVALLPPLPSFAVDPGDLQAVRSSAVAAIVFLEQCPRTSGEERLPDWDQVSLRGYFQVALVGLSRCAFVPPEPILFN